MKYEGDDWVRRKQILRAMKYLAKNYPDRYKMEKELRDTHFYWSLDEWTLVWPDIKGWRHMQTVCVYLQEKKDERR